MDEDNKKRKIISIDITSLPEKYKKFIEEYHLTYKDIFLAGIEQKYKEERYEIISQIRDILLDINRTILNIQGEQDYQKIKEELCKITTKICRVLRLLEEL